MGNNPKPQGAVQNGLESKKFPVWMCTAVLLTGYLLLVRAMLLELHKSSENQSETKMIQIVILSHQVVILQMKISKTRTCI